MAKGQGHGGDQAPEIPLDDMVLAGSEDGMARDAEPKPGGSGAHEISAEDGGSQVITEELPSPSVAAYHPSAPPERHGKLKRVLFPGFARQRAQERGDKDAALKATIAELAIYLLFLVTLTIVTFGLRDKIYYYFTKGLEEEFVHKPGFTSITSNADVYQYLQGGMVDGLYFENWYNGDPVEEAGYILGENKLLGAPQLRQVRMQDNSCSVPNQFKNQIDFCYSQYEADKEDKYSYLDRRLNTTAWHYQSAEELDDIGKHSGRLATYSGAGYAVVLPNNSVDARDTIQALKDNLWIDRGTRALFIDFSVYNGNLNLFSIVRLLVEFPGSGGLVTTASFTTVRLIRYIEGFDFVILACEIVFAVFVLYYGTEELLKMLDLRWRYLRHFWNWVGIINIGIALACIAFAAYRYTQVTDLLEEMLAKTDVYVNFQSLAFWQSRWNELNAVNLFLVWIKIFKYISFNKTMTTLARTLGAAAKDIAGFSIMFFIFFLAYAQFGYLVFGSVLHDFHTFGDSIFTLFRIILGDFDFVALEETNRIIGPIFFVTYIFFVFFVLTNMFLAIIVDTYSEVKERLAEESSELEFAPFFSRKFARFKSKLGMRVDELKEVERRMKMSVRNLNGGEGMNFENLQDVGGAKFANEALEQFDTSKDGILQEGERARLMEELQAERAAKEAQLAMTTSGVTAWLNTKGASKHELDGLTDRVKDMEATLGDVANMVGRVLDTLDGLRVARRRRARRLEELKARHAVSPVGIDELIAAIQVPELPKATARPKRTETPITTTRNEASLESDA